MHMFMISSRRGICACVLKGGGARRRCRGEVCREDEKEAYAIWS